MILGKNQNATRATAVLRALTEQLSAQQTANSSVRKNLLKTCREETIARNNTGYVYVSILDCVRNVLVKQIKEKEGTESNKFFPNPLLE